MTMVSLSSLLRFWQEYRSSKAAERSRPWCAPPPRCCAASRSGTPALREVPMDELVAGDIVQLSLAT
jgi:Mg2+-importing ATPase